MAKSPMPVQKKWRKLPQMKTEGEQMSLSPCHMVVLIPHHTAQQWKTPVASIVKWQVLMRFDGTHTKCFDASSKDTRLDQGKY